MASGAAVDSTTARKSREVYIGNLSIGSVSPDMLTELFNAALVGMVPDPINEPPVINVKMDNTGKLSSCAPQRAIIIIIKRAIVRVRVYGPVQVE